MTSIFSLPKRSPFLSPQICVIFLLAHMWHCLLLYEVHAIPTSTWIASLAKWLTLTVATSTQNTAYMTKSILFGYLQLGHWCYVFPKSGKRGDSVDISTKGLVGLVGGLSLVPIDLTSLNSPIYLLDCLYFISRKLDRKPTLRAVISPGRTLRFDGKEITASNRLLFHRASASTWWLRISNDKTATRTSTKQ